MEDILRALKDGRMTLEEASSELNRRLYSCGHSNIDTGRHARTGVPEVVLASGKTDDQLLDNIGSFVDRSGRALVSRLEPEVFRRIEKRLRKARRSQGIEYDGDARFMVVRSRGHRVEPTGGKVGLITAGTSDIPVCKEAEIMAREMGCETMTFFDIGVAGVHRLMDPLQRLKEWGVDVLIVAAGREGALPTLVSGMIDVPVIGLPISTGYGLHGNGETALFAMLQSCSPLAVVNIDAGFVAGAVASKVANSAALSRKGR